MAYYKNTSGLEYEDEEQGDILKPYDTVASRPPIPDQEEQVRGPSNEDPRDPFVPPNPVRDRIAQKFAPPAPQSPPPVDPQLAQFDADQADNAEFQGVQNQGNLIGNLARSFADVAEGVNETKSDQGFYNALDSQRSEMMKNRQSSQSQRSKIIQAIEARKASQGRFQQGLQQRDRIADQSHEDRLKGIEGQKANVGFKRENLDNRIETSANNLFSKETTPYTKSLDSAKRLGDLLENVKSDKTGRLKTASNVAAAINSDMAQLLTNSPTTTVSDRQHGEIRALESTANKIYQFATSSPQDTIPQEYLDQYETELKILKHSILVNYENKMNELKRGTQNPAKQEIFQNRFESQRDAHSQRQPEVPLTETKEVEGVRFKKVPGGWEEE